MKHDASLAPASYVIDTLEDKIILSAADDEGIGYAIATMLQIITVVIDKFCIARVHIEDAPDKSYRGLMVDLARRWHPASKIFNFIDICFMLMLRYLHLHFMDDQSYTLPSRAFPKLMEQGRCYTREDIEQFCAYAKARGVILIPEIEVPGHASPLTRHYFEIFGNKLDEGEVESIVTENGTVIGTKNIICAGNEKVIDAIHMLLKEVCEMFPDSPFIHIGGDEANHNVWDHCETCREYMNRNGIESSKELYSEFTGRVAQMVFDLGRTPIVWEGFPKEGVQYIPKETIVIAWESKYHLANDLLDVGFKIINASWKPLYHVPELRHDWGAKDILNWNVYTWQNWFHGSVAYLNPIHVSPTENVLGAQVCSWENIYELELKDVLLKSAAMSERVWRTERRDNDESAMVRIGKVTWLTTRLIQDV